MTTMHGLVMVFGAIMPAFVGLANWMIPMMIGAPDMALPRMNNLSFWILPFAFAILVSTLFMEGGGPNFGWTFYAPLSTTYAPDTVNYFIFGVHIMGASSIMGRMIKSPMPVVTLLFAKSSISKSDRTDAVVWSETSRSRKVTKLRPPGTKVKLVTSPNSELKLKLDGSKSRRARRRELPTPVVPKEYVFSTT